MKQQLCARTRNKISIPPYGTVDIPIHRNHVIEPDEHLNTLRFVPRYCIPHLSVDIQLLRNNQSFLRAYNRSSRRIKIPRHTKLGNFRPPRPFRFYDLPPELRDIVLDFAVSDTHPNLETLTLKCLPGFIKGGETGSISLMLKDAGHNSINLNDSIAFPFRSSHSLALTSKSLADDFHIALRRFLLHKKTCWLQLRVHNFNFEAAQLFLRSCSQQQSSQLRVPGKLVLQLSARARSGSDDHQKKWCANVERWSALCQGKKVSPWVIFRRAFFLQRKNQRDLQNALAKTATIATHHCTGEQVVMIMDALDDICKLNSWTKNGNWISIHGRTDEVLWQEKYDFKGVEYGSDREIVEELVED
jgi:hypothetical protein